uniref:Rx N-terminal domain-containing protein n=1 Tax=Setaria viridis TaxID=4556 RepID=A0A4U6SZF4_SETVI|nr:hypothetical protein SEVIR_9G298800v2 [Setaria viridis]
MEIYRVSNLAECRVDVCRVSAKLSFAECIIYAECLQCLKGNLEKLQHLLLRAHTIVEEAEGQLKTLTEAMFRGYVTPVTNITEFVVLLTGCKRMFHSPYSSYIYIDNFMFGRQVEKQQVINILLQDNPSRAPTVLPIIGGCRVGKKTLVGNICSDDRIRSYYSSILHFSGDDIKKIGHKSFKCVRTLVTTEFVSDVCNKEWIKFYSLVALTGKGSKVIIISRLEKLIRFGTVNPIRMNSLSREEYSYLFKVLAFGSANPMDHPGLGLVGKELATVGSLIMLNVYASVLKNNMNISFWTGVLELFRHPKTLLEKDGSSVDVTGFSLSSLSKGGLPQMSFGDIITGSKILPTKFQLVWESRLPPYTVICANCTAEMPPNNHPPSPYSRQKVVL